MAERNPGTALTRPALTRAEPGRPALTRPALTRASSRLAAAGVGSPRVDAELLLAHILGVTRSRLGGVDHLDEAATEAFEGLIARRSRGIPVQHLTGRAPFRHLDLAVGPGVFIPRPETELLVDLVAPALAGPRLLVDLCAGSGAIALAVANEFPEARVVAVEVSPEALAWLGRNARERAEAGDRPITIVAADITDPTLLADATGAADVVLSNPPYVPEAMRGALGREVAHDPDGALFGGADGLALMPAVLTTAARLLRPGGLLAVEHDDSHSGALLALLEAAGDWTAVTGHRDLTGRPRFVRAVRRGLAGCRYVSAG